MSDYYKSLDPIARSRYIEKLAYLNLQESDDPYCNFDKFKDDSLLMKLLLY